MKTEKKVYNKSLIIFNIITANFLTVMILFNLHINAQNHEFIDSLSYSNIKTFTKENKINISDLDSIGNEEDERYRHLTDEDFEVVAKELGIEIAAIKAVVVIEAGSAMKGFYAPGIPVINYDPTMFKKYAPLASSKEGDKNAVIPDGLTGYALKEWTQLVNARKINAVGADMATFWGMFQIGGFNYKICGCSSVEEFVRRMSYSELEQLQMFAVFLVNTDMVKYLRRKDWSGFARRYNGPSYAKRRYHTKMANAYANFSNKK